MDDTSQDQKLSFDVFLQTSQQKAGEISDAAGKDSGAGKAMSSYGDENAPTGVSTSQAMSNENQLKTTQQVRGEYSLPEGGK